MKSSAIITILAIAAVGGLAWYFLRKRGGTASDGPAPGWVIGTATKTATGMRTTCPKGYEVDDGHSCQGGALIYSPNNRCVPAGTNIAWCKQHGFYKHGVPL